MTMPLAVHRKLDLLAGLSEDVAATRAEIVGMLIAQANPDVEELERSLLAYRKLTVGDVLPQAPGGGDGAGDGVVVPLRPPGRPPHRAAS
jgi:hypothetical protein